MHIGGGEPRLSSISRRTRSNWDAFYKSRHDEIKSKPRHQQDDTINGGDAGDNCAVKDDGNIQDSFGTREHKSYVSKVAVVENSDIDDSASVEEDSDDKSDDDDSEDDSDDDDFGDEDYKVNVVEKKGTRQVRSRPAAKRKAAASSLTTEGEEVDLIEMLVDSLLCKQKDLLLKQAKPANHRSHAQCSLLPLKFRFEDDHSSSLPEKTDHQMEIDSLFDDLEMGLWESQIGCTTSSISDDECSISRGMDETPAARCGRGEHDAVLDEQIGILCKYCSAVLLEIKHVLPPFYVESPEKHARKQASEEESNNSVMNEMQFFEESTNSSRGNLESSNCSKKEGSTVLDLIPDTEKQQLYPHQLQGLEFLWRNIAGDIHIKNLRNLPADGGRGCIISHAPGTGKTRLAIVFLQTFMKLYPNCHPVIIAPPGMLLTWEQEFDKWNVHIKFHNLNENKLSADETEFAATIADQTRGLSKNSKARLVKLCCWNKGSSVLGVGYRLFEKLAGDKHHHNKKKRFKRILLESPGLLVLDEGHTPRNNQSLMWKALTKTSTHRRIILSGTPFQNNFNELYNTLCLVNPRFSQQITDRTKKRKQQKEEANAARDEWSYLTNSISKNDERVKEVRSRIEPFVHIHKGDILEKTLPGIRDCMIVLKPTHLQNKLLDKIGQKSLEHAYLASLISVHPSLVADRPEFSDHKRKLKSLELDPNGGVKTQFLMRLIQLSVPVHEKVLIFSEYLDPLKHIKKLIKRHFCWQEGREVIYMDGKLGIKQRQLLINSFNDKHSEAKVLLASQRACSEGINLVGASRLVLLDVAWNPSVERQAICRAYRLGQEKMVYVYHLVTLMEVNKYVRQAEKDRICQLIFGRQGGGGGERDGNRVVWDDKVLEAMVGQQSVDTSSSSMFERIVHQPKESDLINTFGFVDLDH